VRVKSVSLDEFLNECEAAIINPDALAIKLIAVCRELKSQRDFWINENPDINTNMVFIENDKKLFKIISGETEGG